MMKAAAPSPRSWVDIPPERRLMALRLLLVLAEHHTAITALIGALSGLRAPGEELSHERGPGAGSGGRRDDHC